MIDKVIIAEDQEFANLSVQKTMEDLGIRQVDYVFYCDAALSKIQLAKQTGAPYDLLITDLSFEDDGTDQKIRDGFELIRSVRELQPDIMILILSGQHLPTAIHRLLKNNEANAYVRKARHDAQELKVALDELAKGRQYYPRTLAEQVKKSNTYEFTELDINIIRLLSQGCQQKKIPAQLAQNNMESCSLSTIEKRLNRIREEFGFSKNEQLVLFCREAGIL